ncbi:hypothetical protein JNUCC31_25690 [Paenibacillus sp. JNUCC31]|uniref:hypothetical protein n=1 Tax=unclassified Paenibacillus TaxID=185978 RepID=UPI001784BFAF|nr:hypothetical protein [Paenibacillus sp. JNUCC-31]QOS78088.1 hypothetical protein JNUCC31_25690 [Paenibacillus sp. JNUCC-31]
MKLAKETGISLGFLAGTTLGSGIAFLFRFQANEVMASVGLFGIVGAIAGLCVQHFIFNKPNKKARDLP